MYAPLTPPEKTRRAARQPYTPRACDSVIALVARQQRVPIKLLAHERRGPVPVARARQLAMYLSHVVLGRTMAEIGQAFGRDRTTVSYACSLIEDMRDDREFDDSVILLERELELALALAPAEAMRHAA